MKDKLARLQALKLNVKKEYVEINALKKDIVKEMVETDSKEIAYDQNTKATLEWVVEKAIDYEKLMKLYPDVYRLGLKPTFSTRQALHSISKELLNKVIKDCTKGSAQYNLKVGRK